MSGLIHAAAASALTMFSRAKLKAANQNLDTATETLAAALVERALEEALRRRGAA